METVTGKWVIRILAAVRHRPQRRADLYRAVGPDVAPKVFGETLRRMCKAGLLDEDHHPGPRPLTTYQLSEAGRSLLPPLAAMATWHTTKPEPLPPTPPAHTTTTQQPIPDDHTEHHRAPHGHPGQARPNQRIPRDPRFRQGAPNEHRNVH